MAFVRPTLLQLRNRAIAIMNEKLPNVDASLRNSVLNVLTSILAEMANEEFGYLDYLALQCTPYTSTDEYLDAWGMTFSVTRKMASFAEGKITVSGVQNASLLVGTKFKRSDNAVYITTESMIVPASGTVDVSVKSEKVGLNTNAAAGVKMTLLSPVDGMKSEAVVNNLGLTGGTEREGDEAYRARILLHIQAPPRGGAASDWVQWALEVPGVTRAWCYPLEMGPGTVGIRFMMDDTYPNGIPQAGDVQRVQEYLTAYERKPVTATVFVSAPIPQEINITVHDLVPDMPEVRDAIKAEMKDMFWREVSPGAMVYVSKIWGAVSVAAGVESFMLTSPSANEQMPAGKMPVFSTINYTFSDSEG